MFPLAVISDVHGNRWALEAVLEDINKKWISDVVNLGDVLYGPLDPAGTAELLMNYSIPTICGNQDRVLINNPDPLNKRLQKALSLLSPNHIEWLKTFPFSESIENVLLLHGSPNSDSEYLIYSVDETGINYRTEKSLLNILGETRENIILCGHDHKPNVITLPDNRNIVNPGSVGLQAYDDDNPFYHKIENGSPHARYAVIHQVEKNFQIEFITIPYDNKTAAAEARKNGREDWEYWLLTGRVK